MDRWPCTPLSAEGDPVYIYQRRWYLNPQWAHRASAQTVGGAVPPGKYSTEHCYEYAGCKCWEKNWMRVTAFRKDACRHTQIQNWTLAKSGKTCVEMLLLVTASVSRFLELCHGCEVIFKQPWKTNKKVTLFAVGLWHGWLWGKHRSNTVYCALVEELCSERMSPPRSTLLYCTFSSADSFCFFRHWCLHFS